jgi:hypothetical protein
MSFAMSAILKTTGLECLRNDLIRSERRFFDKKRGGGLRKIFDPLLALFRTWFAWSLTDQWNYNPYCFLRIAVNIIRPVLDVKFRQPVFLYVLSSRVLLIGI